MRFAQILPTVYPLWMGIFYLVIDRGYTSNLAGYVNFDS